MNQLLKLFVLLLTLTSPVIASDSVEDQYLSYLTERSVLLRGQKGAVFTEGVGTLLCDGDKVLMTRSHYGRFDQIPRLQPLLSYTVPGLPVVTNLVADMPNLGNDFHLGKAVVPVSASITTNLQGFTQWAPIEELKFRDPLFGLGRSETGEWELRRGDFALLWRASDKRGDRYDDVVKYYQDWFFGSDDQRYERIVVCFNIGDRDVLGGPVVDKHGRLVGTIMGGDGLWFYLIPAEDMHDDLNHCLQPPDDSRPPFVPVTESAPPLRALPTATPQFSEPEIGSFVFETDSTLRLKFQQVAVSDELPIYQATIPADSVDLVAADSNIRWNEQILIPISREYDLENRQLSLSFSEVIGEQEIILEFRMD